MSLVDDVRRARAERYERDLELAWEASHFLRDVGKGRMNSGDMRGQALVTMARSTVADLIDHLEERK